MSSEANADTWDPAGTTGWEVPDESRQQQAAAVMTPTTAPAATGMMMGQQLQQPQQPVLGAGTPSSTTTAAPLGAPPMPSSPPPVPPAEQALNYQATPLDITPMEKPTKEDLHIYTVDSDEDDDLEKTTGTENRGPRELFDNEAPQPHDPAALEEDPYATFGYDDLDEHDTGGLCVLTCVFCAVLVTAMAIVIASLVEYKDDEPKPYLRPTTNYLPPPPSDLVQVCSEKNLLSERGYFECETMCEPAECCRRYDILNDFIGVSRPSCYEDNVEICNAYKEPCAHLQSDSGFVLRPSDGNTTGIPPAPYYLDGACAAKSLQSAQGFQKCRESCTKVECCWNVDISYLCPRSSEEVCKTYQSCTNLLPFLKEDMSVMGQSDEANKITIPEPPAMLEQACSMPALIFADGYDSCNDNCVKGRCCWDPSTNVNCAFQAVCEKYEICVNLEIYVDNLTLSEAPQNLPTLCTEDAIQTDVGRRLCEGSCLKAECCWKTYNCLGQPQCEGYGPCTVLKESKGSSISGETVEYTPDMIAASCYKKGSENGETSGSLCERACAAGACCFDVVPNDKQFEDGSVCLGQNGLVDCSMYEPCSVLDNPPSNPAPTDAPAPVQYTLEVVQGLCLNHIGQGDDENLLCKKACDTGACCFQDPPSENENCQGEDGLVDCTVYAPCHVVHENVTPPPYTASPASNTTDAQDFSFDVIFEACLNHISIPGKQSLCEETCARGDCCFQTGSSTFNDGTPCNDSGCEKYQPCRVLYPDKKSEADVACSEGGARTDCITICAQGLCCFESSDPNKICAVVSPDTVCRDFEKCEVLYGQPAN